MTSQIFKIHSFDDTFKESSILLVFNNLNMLTYLIILIDLI